LFEKFKIFGRIFKAEVKKQHDGKSKGVGVVYFESPKDA